MKYIQLFILSLFTAQLTLGTSLWLKSGNDQRGLFGGKRAYSVGDLITIDVAESSSLAASQNSVRSRQSEIENAVSQFLFANSKMVPIMAVFQALKLKLRTPAKEVAR